MTNCSQKRKLKIVPRKPSGTSGSFEVTRAAAGFSGRQKKIYWPSAKEEIEQVIFGFFKREFERAGATFLNAKRGNIEGHASEGLDFLLTLPGGEAYLELMEVVSPENGQIPYQPGYQPHRPISYADNIFKKLDSRKIKRYGLKHSTPIDLLMYTTHEQYAPNGDAIQVLRSYFRDRPHPFEYAFFIVPIAEDLTPIYVLFSRDHRFDVPPLEKFEHRMWFNLPGASS